MPERSRSRKTGKTGGVVKQRRPCFAGAQRCSWAAACPPFPGVRETLLFAPWRPIVLTPMSTAADVEQPIAERARGFAPVVWLLGKVQSGKTSIIRELTQASDAELGR